MAWFIGLACLASASISLWLPTLAYGQSSRSYPIRQHTEVSFDQLSAQMRFSLDFADAVMQMGQTIEARFPEKMEKLRAGQQLNTDQLHELFNLQKSELKDLYHRHIMAHYNGPQREAAAASNALKLKLKTAFETINIKTFKTFFAQQMVRTRVIFRRSGMGMAIAMISATLVNYVLPFVMIQLGQVQWVPLVLSIPWTFIFAAIPSNLEKLYMRQRLISSLGSKKAYHNYKDFLSSVHSKLMRKSPEHYLVPVQMIEDMASTSGVAQLKVVSVRGGSIFQSMLGKLGFSRQSLTVNSLRSFLLLHDFLIDHPGLDSILKANMPADMKVAYLVQAIYDSGSPKLLNSFEKHFSSSIARLNAYTPWAGLQNWTLRMREVSGLDEIYRLFQEVPSHVDSREILTVWENILLPRYAENFDMDYSTFRNLVREFEVFKAKSFNNGWDTWGDLDFHFRQHLLNASGAGYFKSCRPSPEQILRFLIL